MLNSNNFAIAKLASKESGRFSLNGILVEPNLTVVTDGHCLVSVTGVPETAPIVDPDAEPVAPVAPFAPFIAPMKACLDVAKNNSVSAPLSVTETSSTQRAVISQIAGNVSHIGFDVIDGLFPEYQRVIPNGEKHTVKIHLDVDKLLPILHVLSDFMKVPKNKDTKTFTMSIDPTESRAALMIDAENALGQVFKGLLMPVRLDDK